MKSETTSRPRKEDAEAYRAQFAMRREEHDVVNALQCAFRPPSSIPDEMAALLSQLR